MTDRELMQQALDAMLNFPNDISDDMFESIRVIRARLAQPEREWQGLTDEDRQEIEKWIEFKEAGGNEPVPAQKIITYVESKLREKNSGTG